MHFLYNWLINRLQTLTDPLVLQGERTSWNQFKLDSGAPVSQNLAQPAELAQSFNMAPGLTYPASQLGFLLFLG